MEVQAQISMISAMRSVWTQASAHLGMDIEKVIIYGDSAGGNLAVGVTSLSILRKFRVPDAILLHYPHTNSNVNHFAPS